MKKTVKKSQPKLNRTQLAKMKSKELIKLLPTNKLSEGNHDVRNGTPNGVCVMEAVAWVSGEPHSDHPECADPTLTDMAININDSIQSKYLQRLVESIPALVGSKTKSKRTFFRRTRRAAELVIEQIAINITRNLSIKLKKEFSLGVIEREAVKYIKSLSGRPLKRADLKSVLEYLNYLSDSSSVFDDTGEIDFLSGVEQAWNSDGISETTYSRVLESQDFTSFIDDDRLPNFLFEVATQNA